MKTQDNEQQSEGQKKVMISFLKSKVYMGHHCIMNGKKVTWQQLRDMAEKQDKEVIVDVTFDGHNRTYTAAPETAKERDELKAKVDKLEIDIIRKDNTVLDLTESRSKARQQRDEWKRLCDELNERFVDSFNQHDELTKERDELKAINAELLEALKNLAYVTGFSYKDKPAHIEALAVITKAGNK